MSIKHQPAKSGRPGEGEFAAYAADDIAYVNGDDAADALRKQADAVVAFLGALDEKRIRGLTYDKGKWTVKEVVGCNGVRASILLFFYRM